MPIAEIIIIGTEILLGDIVDTNAQFLARSLRDIGVDLYRKTTVGDNIQRISSVIQQALGRCDIIITSGGLGPTVDDPTREAVAIAVNRQIVYQPELWEQIQARFRRFDRIPTENNKKQAYIPESALIIENPVGTAPAFIMEEGHKVIISLPGVPRELEYLMKHKIVPYLRDHYQLTGIIKVRLLHTAGVGESQIDDQIADLELLGNPTVGLAAHSGQVDIRITAKADSEQKADSLILPVEEEIRKRLGDWIYGVDQQSLEEVALCALIHKSWTITIVEAGLNGNLVKRLSAIEGPFLGGELLSDQPGPEQLLEITIRQRDKLNANVALGVSIQSKQDKQMIYIVIITPQGIQQYTRPYGGPREYGPRWALHHSLDLIRKL